MWRVPEWLWIVALVAPVTAFVILEGWAIINGGEERPDDRGDTLSKYIRKWLGVYPPKPRRRQVVVPLFIMGLVGLVAWLIPHFLMPPV